MKVISATWNIDTLMYDVLVENTKSGMKEEWSANIVVDAGGQFYRPKWAKIPGAEEFIGDQWHTAQWRDDIDLTGKRVAIIGTGPSTGQVAPMIAHKVKELTLYQRSATYVMPRKDMIQPGWRKTLFRWFPLALWFYNVSLWWNVSFQISLSY
jgi:cation diffusion facilitator CzcD-associated flavoprotein CzcO